MNLRTLAGLMVLAVVLGGCASGVNRGPGLNAPKMEVTAARPLASVTLTVADEAKPKLTENLKFNPEDLLNHVKRALDANSLLKPNANEPGPNLEVRIKDVRVRSNFTAIMFGFMAGADLITADVIIKSADGRELDKFEVSTSYALGGLAGGQDSARMGWLYEKFAQETVQELKKQ